MITKVLLKNQITNSILKTLIKDTVPYFHRETFQSLVDATLFFRKPSSWLLIVSNEYFYKLEDKTVSMNSRPRGHKVWEKNRSYETNSRPRLLENIDFFFR